jgi:ABC-type dipeptide/oligopeptide/nickel transport system permease component
MKFVIQKLFALIITLFIVSLLAFLAFQIIPGDPTTKMLGTEATAENVAALRAQLGLDRPMLVRYWEWLTGFLVGDLGTSYSYSLPVSEMLADKLPTTILLTLMSFVITIVLAIPLGILAGSVRSRTLDKVITALDQVVMSVPPFFIGMLACYIFGLTLRFFVPGEFVAWSTDPVACLHYLIFPAFSIAIPRIAMTVKMLRGAILKEMGQDYMRTARSRGSRRSVSLRRHALRNALLPTITFLAVSLAELMTGTIIIEQVFTIPGVGRLLLSSIGNRDYPVVQAIVVILAAWIVLVNFLADLINQLVDPRLRLH